MTSKLRRRINAVSGFYCWLSLPVAVSAGVLQQRAKVFGRTCSTFFNS